MRILYSTFTQAGERPYQDGSARERCYNFADELTARKHRTLVVSQKILEENFPKLADFDIYVFHRPFFSEKLAKIVSRLERSRLLIADYDDNSFHTSSLATLPGPLSNKKFMAGMCPHLINSCGGAQLFSNFTVSTVPLKGIVEKFFSPAKAVVLHNGVPRTMRSLFRIVRDSRKWHKRQYAIGYASGSDSHNRDFQLVADTLYSYIRKTAKNMLVCGTLDFSVPSGLDMRIDRHPRCIYPALPFLLANCRAIIAPLEITSFTTSKSAIKLYDGALSGCKVIATSIPDFDRFSSPLLKKCVFINDWQDALESIDAEPVDIEKCAEEIESQAAIELQVDKFCKEFM